MLKESLDGLNFEEGLLLKMVLLNFRMVSHMFNFTNYDEIFDTLNELEMLKQRDKIPSHRLTHWHSVQSVFLVSVAVMCC